MTEKPTECDCCYWETDDLKSYRDGIPEAEHWLCEVCACTHLSKAVVFPLHCPDRNLYSSLGWIANRILAEIRKTKE